jgi:hypothetical protein
MHFSHLVLCDRREGQSSQERYEQQLAEVRLMDQLGSPSTTSPGTRWCRTLSS